MKKQHPSKLALILAELYAHWANRLAGLAPQPDDFRPSDPRQINQWAYGAYRLAQDATTLDWSSYAEVGLVYDLWRRLEEGRRDLARMEGVR